MIIINKDEAMQKRYVLVNEIIKGSVFIHPTDTIYGIGCNALDEFSVAKIRKMKNRTDQPFSVMAPSIEWIRQNCVVPKSAEEWLSKLPGPYTLVFRMKNSNAISKGVNPGLSTLGVRFPSHWFADLVSKANVPFVTTSANITGQNFMTSIEDLEPSIARDADFILYEGEKHGRPSAIVNFLEEKALIINR